jgi:hypothetical protein
MTEAIRFLRERSGFGQRESQFSSSAKIGLHPKAVGGIHEHTD